MAAHAMINRRPAVIGQARSIEQRAVRSLHKKLEKKEAVATSCDNAPPNWPKIPPAPSPALNVH